ncbi:TPA: intermembrane transport protein PqiB [Morganella morganii]|uniref:intermembrane transport protein PqiB n=1 Tax=Morganella morganii TaxID=582 RepID=UPI000F5A2286|nr:intermembrane transport protein PqiB [Morganella morganii]MBT0333329.1 intermembrane transport protein PqiB [Morganella morganii subsp. morganii]MBT0354903.1 intermembrane transport protein PqiB [Morganella morganii subsp. morganii]WHZ52692.1 intermembrane transport protein PqiB [Morganella morganii]HBU8232048.1 intermembrane transport protein PqiB [Morganella morganii]HCU0241942.1 intermembrane transport protein PqiB [Morganella morganii]
MNDKTDDLTEAKVSKLKSWSPVWIIPIVTVLIGAWILISHFRGQGPEITLITYNAEGVEAGKTKIKSRSVDVGVVESVMLDQSYSRVIIKARLNAEMKDVLRKDTVFWVVKPTVGREGVSGLGTLLSGAYIQVQPANTGGERREFELLDSPPLASPDAKGIRVILTSQQAGQLNPGDAVLFRGYRVGSVETAEFNLDEREMQYELFINAPYDKLVTTNARFWKDSGIAFDMSSQGVSVQVGSLSTLFSGGVSFDVPDGWQPGEEVNPKTLFKLFDNQKSTQNSLYTEYKSYLLFFSDSVRGLSPGAPVEFRGIRLGTVAQVPFYAKGLGQTFDQDFRIPVLIHIEPERFEKDVGKDFKLAQELETALQQGLRASLKSGNLLTGALYVDLDFYPDQPAWKAPMKIADYDILPTTSGGLVQLQQKVLAALDKINGMPIEPMMKQATETLRASEKTIAEAQKTLSELNVLLSSKEFKALPKDMQTTLRELNRSMQGIQPGSPAYNKLVDDMQRLDQVLRELQPVLRTLNNKSNALVFEAAPQADPQPKKAKN